MCGNKVHVQKYYRPKVTGSSGNPPNKYTNNLTEWLTNKHAVSDTKDLATSTMKCNKKVTSFAPLTIMVLVHGSFTGRIGTGSGNDYRKREVPRQNFASK